MPYDLHDSAGCPAMILDQPLSRPGLVASMPGSQACVRRFESPLGTQTGWPGREISVRRCRELLSMVLSELKHLLELFVKRKEFLPGTRCRCNMN